MSLARGLKSILKPEVVVRTIGGDVVELREKSRDVDMRVRVLGIPATFIAIRLRRGDHLPSIDDGSWRQISDYLLVIESENRTHAVFVELKKTQTKETKPREQLLRSLPLLEYLRSVWEIECGTSLQDRLSVHYSILFEQTSPRFAKQSVRIKPTERISPEPPYKGIAVRTFVGTSVPLSALMGE